MISLISYKLTIVSGQQILFTIIKILFMTFFLHASFVSHYLKNGNSRRLLSLGKASPFALLYRRSKQVSVYAVYVFH